MSRQTRRQEILEIIERNPGATGATIFMELAARSWATRWFGQDSFWAFVLSPSVGGIYVHLAGLEHDKKICSEWGWKMGDRPRRRHYYPATQSQESNGIRTNG